MKPRNLLFLAVCVLLANVPCLRAEDMDRTGRLHNGRAWAAWGPIERIRYMQGLADGIEVCSASNNAEFPEQLACQTCSVGDIIDVVTSFYAEDRGVRSGLPVVMDAIRVELSKLARQQLRAADKWWRVNRTKAPNAGREELARVSTLISLQPSNGALAGDVELPAFVKKKSSNSSKTNRSFDSLKRVVNGHSKIPPVGQLKIPPLDVGC